MSTSPDVPIASTSIAGPAPKFWLNPPPSSTSPPLKLSSFPSAPLRISRVAQLDASLLDNELEGILHAPVKTALEGIRTARGGGAASWEPEVLAILRLTILKMSLWGDTSLSSLLTSLRNGGGQVTKEARRKGLGGGDASYGSSLQNLRYRNEAKHSRQGLQSTAHDSRLTVIQKLLYTLLVVLPPYLNVRLQDRMMSSSWSDEPLPRSWLSLIDLRRGFTGRSGSARREEEMIQWKREWKRSVWELLRVSEKFGNMLGLCNFLVFLYNGRYRSLVDRLLKMRLVYAQRTVTPNVSFEYLNRQLVWEAFTEFLLFLMPLINLRKLRLRISKTLSSQTSRSSKTLRAIATSLRTPISTTLGLSSLVNHNSSTSSSTSSSKTSEKKHGKFSFLPSSTCPICYQSTQQTPPITSLPTSALSATGASDPTNPSTSLTTTHHSTSSAGPVIVSDTSVKIPYLTNCEANGDDETCRYCYYCLVGVLVNAQENLEEGWECLRCGDMVTGCKREKVDGLIAVEEDELQGESEEEEESEEEPEG